MSIFSASYPFERSNSGEQQHFCRRKMRIGAFLLLCFIALLPTSPAQPAFPHAEVFSAESRRVPGLSPTGLRIRKTTVPIALDGHLNEAAWAVAEVAVDFTQQFPVDTVPAEMQTEVRLTFDDRFLYVGVVCRQHREDYTVLSLKRDFPNATSDVINVLISPSRDGLNGFLFGVNPLNVQREALIDNGSTLSLDWDNRWNSAVANHDDHWVAEMAIPFKTLRYSRSEQQNIWAINFVRARLKNWEVSTWHPVPRQYSPNNLAFCRPLHWEEPPPPPGLNAAIIPYVTGRHETDFRRQAPLWTPPERVHRSTFGIGADAKIGLTPSLNLDLTVNPDFSQVEVDRQVVNLSRFELFFPERRQFFLENRDLFAMFGFPNTRPFFSRRIGLTRNPLTGQNETVPIVAGARLSGKLTNEWRVGLLNMQTARIAWDSLRALPAANFTVATLQRKVFSRSAISAIWVNKENFLGALTEPQRAGWQRWNRVAGVEFNLYSADNRWEGEWYYHRSFSPDPSRRGHTAAQFLGYFDRHFTARMGYLLVDSFYTAEAGFVPRKGFQSFFPGGSLIFYPQTGKINNWLIRLSGEFTYSLFFQETDREVSGGVELTLHNQAEAGAYWSNNYTYLFEDFDPTNLYRPGTLPLPGGVGYTYNNAGLYFSSSRSYDFQGWVQVTAGQFFNGTAQSVAGECSYRWQPFGTFALSCNYNRIRLPSPYAQADVWILGSRAELAFSRKWFVSAFFQWNTQANNFNVNARLQWRFAPVSDVFLVYTDNSFAQPIGHTDVRFLSPKNRALVLKVVYWLNA